MDLNEKINEYQGIVIRIKAQMHDLTDQLIGMNNKIIACQEVMNDISKSELADKQAIEDKQKSAEAELSRQIESER